MTLINGITGISSAGQLRMQTQKSVMSGISRRTHILSFSSSSTSVAVAVTIGVVLALSMFPMVLAEQESSDILRLPMESIGTGESENVCGAKTTATSCPVKCLRTNPVCGADGVTYLCGCAEAECAGTKVAKMGICEVGRSAPPSIQALLLVHIVWHIVLGFSIVWDLI